MTNRRKFQTPQEEFWAGDFGTDYIGRNDGPGLLASNIQFFVTALRQAGQITSCLELGANIGMNLRALQCLFPDMELRGIEINTDAASKLAALIGKQNVTTGSIFDFSVHEIVDLVLVKGVLIHINPAKLDIVYEKMYRSSNRLILVCEYYNPSPVTISYRGHSDRLFKRDFAGELLDAYSDLSLVDYGFAYHRDEAFPQDDISWFLLKKN
jgi:pseudaminic acid biosynthesis-associated methylase